MYTRAPSPTQPFYLHDAEIVAFSRKGNDLVLSVESVYLDGESDETVSGIIRLKDVSFDDSYVLITNIFTEENARLEGEQMTLERFLREKKDIRLWVLSEYDGFRTYVLKGNWFKGDLVCCVTLEIYYTGEFIYDLQ